MPQTRSNTPPNENVDPTIILFLTKAASPTTMTKLVGRIKKSFPNVEDDQVKTAIWRLTGSGLAEFNDQWKISIPKRNRNYALTLTKSIMPKAG